MTCPHGGLVTPVIIGSRRFILSGSFALTLGDSAFIAGCPATDADGQPQPCLTVQWLSPASLVIEGVPALTMTSSGICLSGNQAPQGPVLIQPAQFRVMAD
jgi:hypothetical protein